MLDNTFSRNMSYQILSEYLSESIEKIVVIEDIDGDNVGLGTPDNVSRIEDFYPESINKELFNKGLFQKSYFVQSVICDNYVDSSNNHIKYIIFTPVDYNQESVDEIVNICKKQDNSFPIEIQLDDGYTYPGNEVIIYSEIQTVTDNTQENKQDIEPRGGFGYCSLCNESYPQYELTSTCLSSGEKVTVCPKCLKDVNSGMYDNIDINNAN